MDLEKVFEALKRTIIPDLRAEAEAYLDSVQKIIGFAPNLLQIVMQTDKDLAVRQAGVIYLKNLVTNFWDKEKEPGEDAAVFTIHEQDRHFVREHIIEAIIHSPEEAIKVQLAVCVQVILRMDFPGRWPQAADKIRHYLEASDGQSWMGALTTLYKLVKIYEYKKAKQRGPLVETMRVLLPILMERMVALMSDPSAESVFLQKMILKVMYGLIQHSLRFDMISMEEFGKWMEICRVIVKRPVPEETKAVEEDERPELIWWKCKKWAINIMTRVFERYGSPGQVSAQYNQFADYYLKSYVGPSIETVLGVCHQYAIQEYVSPRVLRSALLYLQYGMGHAFSWKFIKSHMDSLVKTVVFPILCHSDADQELWEEDPKEYIRCKYDVFGELIDPQTAASNMLSAAMKRKKVLPNTVAFMNDVLADASSTPRQVDGIVHMLGTLAPNLLKKKMYKLQLEKMIVTHILPKLESSDTAPFLAARAAWCLQTFSEAPFATEANLRRTVDLIIANIVSEERELPVRVEAAIALQMILHDQSKAEKMVEPNIKPLVMALLKLISESENDDLSNVMDRLINTYMEQIVPVAVEVAEGLANVFEGFLSSEEDAEEKSIAAMGILGTLESILNVMDEHKDIMVHLEQIVLRVIQVVINHSVMDFYEEVFGLVESLTTSQISQPMWEVFEAIHQMFNNDGMEFFTDMMPALHNYVTVDMDAFLANPRRIQIIIEMCQKVLTSDEVGESDHTHAAKLLEVLVLQYKERINEYLTLITSIVITRLGQNIQTSELRTMCLQVVIAGLHYDPALMLQTLQSLQPMQPLVDVLIPQWLNDTDCFLGIHDRKISIIGLCTLLGLSQQMRPQAVTTAAPEVLPSLLLLFDGLEKAYKSQAEMENKSDSDDDEEDVPEVDDGLASDEDEIDEDTLEYLERLNKLEQDSGNEEAFSESTDSGDEFDETEMEMYTTPLDGPECPLDEFILFKSTLAYLQSSEPTFYQNLIAPLTESQQKELQKVMTLANQREEALRSKAIQNEGGYQFAVQQVPSTFNFGSP